MTDTFTWRAITETQGGGQFLTARAQFGDGYSQEVALGLNNETQKWTVVVQGEDVAPSLAFIRAHKGYQSFYWKSKFDATPQLYRCKQWTPTNQGGNVYTMAYEFEQVFAP